MAAPDGRVLGEGEPKVIPLDTMARQRIQRGVEHLHQLGPRATSEFLADVANRIGGLPAIVGLLEEYQRRGLPATKRRKSAAAGGRA